MSQNELGIGMIRTHASEETGLVPKTSALNRSATLPLKITFIATFHESLVIRLINNISIKI